jgi:asparagine synthase (glutamine-hydrolysing)
MNTFHGCWFFDDRTGIRALATLPVSSIRHENGETALLSWDGPCLCVRGVETNRLRDCTLERAEELPAIGVGWDGRLDNHKELRNELGCTEQSTQADCVAAAFQKWQASAFARLRGDWAATIWNPQEQVLLLAKDPMGARPLYYASTSQAVFWSNSLAWLVHRKEARGDLNLEYLAGWLSFFADSQLTPYSEIHSVPPSSYVRTDRNGLTIRRYWEFKETRILRYREERDYEEHFRIVLTNSVRCRLRSKKPLLAELSGGMDSSTIVCVADTVFREESELTPRLDTLSFYDDSEPNWNERPYFSLVEARRGREGLHHQVDAAEALAPVFDQERFAPSPADLGHGAKTEKLLSSLAARGYGAILSGIGGDEFTGGVPTPIPELADLLAGGQFRSLASSLNDWSLAQRRPWMHVLAETLHAFLPAPGGLRFSQKPPSWLTPSFRQRYRHVFAGYDKPLRLFERPSFQECLSTVEALRRQLAASATNPETTLEKRYPYLDVDLLLFLFSVPRRLLVQPRRRRYLMRRALVGIVPDEILNRKRKAYVVRAPAAAIAARWKDVRALTQNMVAETLGIVSAAEFLRTLEDARDGRAIVSLPVQRMLQLEGWLRNITKHRSFSSLTGERRVLTLSDFSGENRVPAG